MRDHGKDREEWFAEGVKKMGNIFEKQFEAGWRDMDPNGHMANSAYLEFAVNTRIAFFASQGFAATDFQKQGFRIAGRSRLRAVFVGYLAPAFINQYSAAAQRA